MQSWQAEDPFTPVKRPVVHRSQTDKLFWGDMYPIGQSEQISLPSVGWAFPGTQGRQMLEVFSG
jgi:hypothetical protein